MSTWTMRLADGSEAVCALLPYKVICDLAANAPLYGYGVVEDKIVPMFIVAASHSGIGPGCDPPACGNLIRKLFPTGRSLTWGRLDDQHQQLLEQTAWMLPRKTSALLLLAIAGLGA